MEQLKFKLSQSGIPVASLAELTSGLKLYDILLKQLPTTQGLLRLKQRLRTTNLNQTANCVININIILKYIKQELDCPDSINSMSAFGLLEDQSKLIEFIDWLLKFKAPQEDQSLDASDIQQQQKSESNYHQEERNEDLSNLYFVSDAKEEVHQEDYSLNIPREEVIRANTGIKVLRPKTNFNDNSYLSHKQLSPTESLQKHPKLSLPPRPKIPPLPRNSSRSDQSPLVTSKQPQKYPLQLLKGTTSTSRSSLKALQQSDVRVTTSRSQRQNHNNVMVELHPFQTKKSQKLLGLQKQVKEIQKSISKQKKEISAMKRRGKSSNKKPVDIGQVSSSNKDSIVQWLISINLLNSLARKRQDSLHKICKNGVIFPELINQKKQRTDPEVKYESKPTKSAQIHANYRRVFDHLAKLNNFSSPLLYSYENFVPEVGDNTFWAFMMELMDYYRNSGKKKMSSLAKSVQEDLNPLPAPIKTARQDYDQIRYSLQQSNGKPKITDSKRSCYDNDDDCVQQPLRARITSSNQYIQQSRIDTNTNNSIMSMGSYQQLRVKKILCETPTREHSSRKISDSLDRSRMLKLPLGTSNQPTKQHQTPQTSKEMYSIATTYLKSQCLGIDVQSLPDFRQMFEDPIRNGTLLMLVVCKHFNLKSQQFLIKPTTINDCRYNLNRALRLLKDRLTSFPEAYMCSSEEIIKGEKSLFYGIIYHLASLHNGKTETSFNGSFVHSSSTKQTLTAWVNSLKTSFESMKYIQIDTFESVVEYMSTGILLNQLACLATKRSLKLVYDKPSYQVQHRANIIKSLQAMVQKQIIESSYLWKAKKIAGKDHKTILALLDILRRKLSSHSWQRGNTVSFQHLIKAYCTK